MALNIALIGYGKMGHIIEKVAENRGHIVVGRFGSRGIDTQILQQTDVAIEFSKPEAAPENIKCCMDYEVPVVVGTTGWLEKYDEAVDYCRKSNGALLVASNFSLGVNLFFAINKKLAEYMNTYSEYEVELEEIHHTQKLDTPSGTAITIAHQIAEKMQRKNGWSLDRDHSENKIHIEAKREADVKGTHIVKYRSEIDTIEIKHEAHSREGFALGAVIAAEFLAGKTGVFSMEDVLNL